jgi:hypothetical protein
MNAIVLRSGDPGGATTGVARLNSRYYDENRSSFWRSIAAVKSLHFNKGRRSSLSGDLLQPMSPGALILYSENRAGHVPQSQ